MLKLTALITMIIDHVNTVLIMPLNISTAPYWETIVFTGRMAFPIYAFLIAEGCRKTRSMLKYIFRLLLFMIISEFFYVMAFYSNNYHGFGLARYAFGQVLKIKFGNIFTTLTFGVVAIYIYQRLAQTNINKKMLAFLKLGTVVLVSYITEYFGGSYGTFGILLIFLLYLFDKRSMQAGIIILWSAVFYLLRASFNGLRFLFLEEDVYWQWFVFASLSSVLIMIYTGKRGKSIKWAFYMIYPLHLLILVIIREFIY